MANQSTGGDKPIDRRTVLQVGTALAATGLLHGRHAEAQQRQPIIDCQVHAYAANTPERPWKIVPNWPAHGNRACTILNASAKSSSSSASVMARLRRCRTAATAVTV